MSNFNITLLIMIPNNYDFELITTNYYFTMSYRA